MRYLRASSYHYGAQLLFVSGRSETLVKRLYTALESLAFERSSWEEQTQANDDETTSGNLLVTTSSKSNTKAQQLNVSTSPSKPVWIPFGYDTLDKIGVDSWLGAQQTFVNLFVQEKMNEPPLWLTKEAVFNEEAMSKHFAEPDLDSTLEYKCMMVNGE